MRLFALLFFFAPQHLILTLSAESGCASSMHLVYYRVWQTKTPHTQPVLLLDRREGARIDQSVHGTARLSEVFLEYYVDSVEVGFRRPELQHYV